MMQAVLSGAKLRNSAAGLARKCRCLDGISVVLASDRIRGLSDSVVLLVTVSVFVSEMPRPDSLVATMLL